MEAKQNGTSAGVPLPEQPGIPHELAFISRGMKIDL